MDSISRLFDPFGQEVHDGGGALVGAASKPQVRHFLELGDVSQVSGNQQRPGVRNGVVHGTDTTVTLDAEVPDEFQNRIGVVFAIGVGFKQVQKDVVGTIFGLGVARYAIGNFDFPHSLDQADGGAVAGEIEEVAGAFQLTEFLGAQIPFQPVQGQGADASHVHPRTNHGKDVGVSQLGNRLVNLKSPYFMDK